MLDTVSGGLSETAKTTLTTAITSKIDSIMVNVQGQSQINGRTVYVSDSENILDTDAISVNLSIGLVKYNKVINEQDDYDV